MDLNLRKRFSSQFPAQEGNYTKSPLDWMRQIFEVNFSIITIVGNLLVIIAIVLVKVLRQQPKNYMMLSLAVADLLVGALVVPVKLALTENNQVWEGGRYACYLWITVDILSCAASILSLSVLSLDRHIAILHPLFYKVKSTPSAAYAAVTATWTLAILTTIPHFVLAVFYLEISDTKSSNFAVCLYFPPYWLQIFSAVAFLLPLSLIIFASGNIWRVLNSQKFRSKPKLGTSMPPAFVDTSATTTQVLSNRLLESLQEKKGCIMMGIVTGVFAVCLVPFFMLLLIEGVIGILGKELDVPVWTFDALLWLGYFNSCVNPFIYTMFSSDFRFAFKELICLRGSTLNAKIRNEAYSKQVRTSSGNASRTSYAGVTAKQRQGLDSAVSNPARQS